MDGGRKKSLAEKRPLTTHMPSVSKASYRASASEKQFVRTGSTSFTRSIKTLVYG